MARQHLVHPFDHRYPLGFPVEGHTEADKAKGDSWSSVAAREVCGLGDIGAIGQTCATPPSTNALLLSSDDPAPSRPGTIVLSVALDRGGRDVTVAMYAT